MRFCKKCKIETDRYKSGDCKPCVKTRASAWQRDNPEKANARSAAYKAANIDKVRERNADYRAANRDKCNAAVAAHAKAYPDRVKARSAAYRAANPEKRRAANVKWRNANLEKAKAISAAWKKENPEDIRRHYHNRRARECANNGSLSKGLSAKLYKLQRGKCVCCGELLGDNFHLDHIMPLALGGSNTDNNIQLLCAPCNLSKSKKHPISFMQERGFLL